MNFIERLLSQVVGSFKKYPLPSALIVLSAIAGGLLASNVENEFTEFYYYVLRVFMALHLMIPILMAVSITDKSKFKKDTVLAVQSLVIVFLTLYTFYIFPTKLKDFNEYFTPAVLAYRYIAMLVVSVVSLFILPYIGKFKGSLYKTNRSLWVEVVHVVTAIAVAVIYGVIVQIGLSLALAAVDTLWEVDVNEWLYLLIIVFAYNFVGYLRLVNGIDAISLDVKPKLGKIADVLAKYILVPLTAIYTIILYPYIIKIIATGEWPNNMITGLTLVYLILVYSSVYLLFFSDEVKLLKLHLRRLLPLLSIPIILMQLYGLWIRVDAYGYTVNRIELISLSLLSLALSVYFASSKKVNVVAVPLVFMTLAVVCTPVAFVVGKQSQIARQVGLFEEYGFEFSASDKLLAYEELETIPYSQKEEISSGIEYLVNYHGVDTLSEFLNDEMFSDISSKSMTPYGISEKLLTELNVNYSYDSSVDGEYVNNYYYYYLNPTTADFSEVDLDQSFDFISLASEEDISVDVSTDSWRFELDGNIYTLNEEQIDVIKLSVYRYEENQEVLLLESATDNSVLLLVQLNVEDTRQDDLVMNEVVGWVLR